MTLGTIGISEVIVMGIIVLLLFAGMAFVVVKICNSFKSKKDIESRLEKLEKESSKDHKE
jgi:hypothetical protein